MTNHSRASHTGRPVSIHPTCSSLNGKMTCMAVLALVVHSLVLVNAAAQAPIKDPELKWFGRWALAIEASKRDTKPLLLLVEGADGIEPGFAGHYEDVFKDTTVLRLLKENFIVMKGLPAVSNPTELQGAHQIGSGQSRQINFYMPSAASDTAEKEKPVLVINEEKKIVEFETHIKALIPAATPDQPQASLAPDSSPQDDPTPVDLIIPPKIHVEGLSFVYRGSKFRISEEFFILNDDKLRERHILVIYGWDGVYNKEDEEFTSHYLDLMLEDLGLNQVIRDNFFVFRLGNIFPGRASSYVNGGTAYRVIQENIRAGSQLILLESTNEKIEGAYRLNIVSQIVRDRKSASELHRWLCQSAGIPYVQKPNSRQE